MLRNRAIKPGLISPTRNAARTPAGPTRFALAAVGLLALGGCPQPADNNGDTGGGNGIGGTTTRSLSVNGAARSYMLHTPTGFTTGSSRTVVILFHGSGFSGDAFLSDAKWADKADAANFIAVAPDALPGNPDEPANLLTNPRLWQATQFSLGGATTNPDVLFFDALLAELPGVLGFSFDQVFIAGHSGGGSMCFVLASERGNRVLKMAAVASHWIGIGPAPTPPTPTLFIVGSEDPLAPLTGGSGLTPSIDFTLDRWALALGCDAAPVTVSDAGGVRTDEYAGCNSDVIFRAIFLSGQGHTWPGARFALPSAAFGPNTNLLDATDTIWDFFAGAGTTTGGMPAAIRDEP
ncbi:MAG: PHB depolymerase family esterase [Phycisphaerae bacterium]